MTQTDLEQLAVASADVLEDLLLPVLPRAYGFAVRLTGNGPDADDLLQEAALRACRFFDQFEPGTNFRAWFFKIVANCFYGERRKARRRGQHVSLEDAPGLFLYARTAEAGLHESETSPAEAVMSRLDAEHIARALDALPDPYRAVASLYLLEDLKYSEIADVLGLPIGTVRSRLHRGRRMLQRRLWDLAVERGLVSETTGE